MAISVVCAKCQARFNVSDKFAGQTGPCPKCKQPIKIPKAMGDVTIHGPSKPAESSQSGQMPTAPIIFKEESVSPISITILLVTGVLVLLAAYQHHAQQLAMCVELVTAQWREAQDASDG